MGSHQARAIVDLLWRTATKHLQPRYRQLWESQGKDAETQGWPPPGSWSRGIPPAPIQVHLVEGHDVKRNSRLSLALHTLSHMAGEPGRRRTSSDIADHAGTNPVVVRRVLGKLRAAGLLVSEKGQGGGWRLAKAPAKITLADVYQALDESLVSNEAVERPKCEVEQALYQKVSSVLQDVENTLLNRLSETTIADMGG